MPDLEMRSQIDQLLPDDLMHLGESRPAIAGAITRILHPRSFLEGFDGAGTYVWASAARSASSRFDA